MSYIYDTLDEYFNRRDIAELKFSSYLTNPQKVGSMERLLEIDKRINEDIQQAEKYIKLLKQYRMKLYERSKATAFMTYKETFYFWRKQNYYTKKVFYYIEKRKTPSDPSFSEITLEKKEYPGSQRFIAFQDWKKLKKENPLCEFIEELQK